MNGDKKEPVRAASSSTPHVGVPTKLPHHSVPIRGTVSSSSSRSRPGQVSEHLLENLVKEARTKDTDDVSSSSSTPSTGEGTDDLKPQKPVKPKKIKGPLSGSALPSSNWLALRKVCMKFYRLLLD